MCHRDRCRHTLLHVLVAASLTLAAACGDGGPSNEAEQATIATGASSTTVQPATTSAGSATSVSTTVPVAPTRTSAQAEQQCPASNPIDRLDLDGDGTLEGAWILERVGGQRLVICGPATVRNLDLEYGAWYLAVADVEPDGTDELFLGEADIEDTPAKPAALLHWVDPTGPELEPFAAGFTGLMIGPRSGGGCVDVDRDGTRELVSLFVDDAASSDEVIGWRREVSSAVPWQRSRSDREGVFDRVSDGAAVELLSLFSCGDDIIPLTRVAPPAAICDQPQERSFEADPIDLDGDGRADRVLQHEARGAAALSGASFGGLAVTVCLAYGVADQLPVGGQGEVFGIGEGPGDHPVIWTGGTGVAAAYQRALVVDEGRLVAVGDPADEFGFGLWDGIELWDEPRFGASGCEDVDGDGIEEFTQIEATVDGTNLFWTRKTWAFDGRRVTPGPETAGTRPLPGGFDVERDGFDVLAGLTDTTC